MTNQKTISLAELFAEPELRVLHKLVNNIKTGHADTKSLRIWLRSHAAMLESKGVLADYLYYALCYQFELS